MLFVCYPGCSSCRKAEKWLDDHGAVFEKRDISENNPTEEELRAWQKKSGLPLSRFFNTSGRQYRALALKERLPSMSEDEKFALLASDGMLVKRPLLVTEDTVIPGFTEESYAAAIG